MENNMRYIYQLSLANGEILTHETEGLFSMQSPEHPESRVLINSAVLIKMYEKPVEVESEVVNAPEDYTLQPIESLDPELFAQVKEEMNKE